VKVSEIGGEKEMLGSFLRERDTQECKKKEKRNECIQDKLFFLLLSSYCVLYHCLFLLSLPDMQAKLLNKAD